jgi:hypothetical protein
LIASQCFPLLPSPFFPQWQRLALPSMCSQTKRTSAYPLSSSTSLINSSSTSHPNSPQILLFPSSHPRIPLHSPHSASIQPSANGPQPTTFRSAQSLATLATTQ